jgi:hypothetical protein
MGGNLHVDALAFNTSEVLPGGSCQFELVKESVGGGRQHFYRMETDGYGHLRSHPKAEPFLEDLKSMGTGSIRGLADLSLSAGDCSSLHSADPSPGPSDADSSCDIRAGIPFVKGEDWEGIEVNGLLDNLFDRDPLNEDRRRERDDRSPNQETSSCLLQPKAFATHRLDPRVFPITLIELPLTFRRRRTFSLSMLLLIKAGASVLGSTS